MTRAVSAANAGRQSVAVERRNASVTGPAGSVLTPPPTPPSTDESETSSSDEAVPNFNEDDGGVVVHRHPEACTCGANHDLDSSGKSIGKRNTKGKGKAAAAGPHSKTSTVGQYGTKPIAIPPVPLKTVPLAAASAVRNVIAAPYTSIVLGAVLANAALFNDTNAMETVAELLESLIPIVKKGDKGSGGTEARSELGQQQQHQEEEKDVGAAAGPALPSAPYMVDPAPGWQTLFTDDLIERIASAHTMAMGWSSDVLDNLTLKLLQHAPERVPDFWRQSIADFVIKDLFAAIPKTTARAKSVGTIKWSIAVVGALLHANWCPKDAAAFVEDDEGTTAAAVEFPTPHAGAAAGGDAGDDDGGDDGVGSDDGVRKAKSVAKDLQEWALPVIQRCVMYQTGFDTSVAATNGNEIRKVAITFLSTHCPEKCATCGICDEDFFESKPVRVSDQRRGTEHFKKAKCTHAYCEDCLKQWIQTNLDQNLAYVRCPCTDCPVSMYEDDIQRIAGDVAKTKFATLRKANHAERLIELIKNKKLYAEVSKEAKPCPRCHVVINRYAGCNSMMCNCGHSFNWSTTTWPTVAELKKEKGEAAV